MKAIQGVLALGCLLLVLTGSAQTNQGDFKMLEALKTKAEAGDVEAQFDLGMMYFNMETAERNDAEAVKWFLKAAEQGKVRAKYQMGHCYQLGVGVRIDLAEATKWFRKAAEEGDANAQYMLAVNSECGAGVPRAAQFQFCKLFEHQTEGGVWFSMLR